METKNRLVVARGVVVVAGGMSEGDQKAQTSSNKISKFWRYNVYSMVTPANKTIAYLKVGKRL